MNAARKTGNNDLKQTVTIILAAILCFAGPTYFVAMANNIIPHIYAATIGVILFVIGVVLILRTTKG